MTNPRWRLAATTIVALLLTSCASAPLRGEHLTLVQDLMAESARLKTAQAQSRARADQAAQAVTAWRTGAEAGTGAGAANAN